MLLTVGQLGGVVTVLIVVLIAFYLWMKDVPMYMGKHDLTGKTCIITGANAGIGYQTSLEFAKRNARVILACRSRERGEAAKEAIVAATGNKNVVIRQVDLSSLKSVRQFAQRINEEEERLDILVNNAGVIGLPHQITEDGLELNFAINHFGPFLLTNLLIDKLEECKPSRIVNVSSVVQRMGTIDLDNLKSEKYYSAHKIYFNSKLANVLFTRELARRMTHRGITAVCLHPGSVQTDLLKNMPLYVRLSMSLFRAFLRTAEEGAQTTLYCALAEEVRGLEGKYFADCRVRESQVNTLANDEKLYRELWRVSCRCVGICAGETTVL